MQKILILTLLVISSVELAGCGYTPEQRGVSGAALGGATGAAIGASTGGGPGAALAGGVLGAATGAIIGANTAPPPPPPPPGYYPSDPRHLRRHVARGLVMMPMAIRYARRITAIET